MEISDIKITRESKPYTASDCERKGIKYTIEVKRRKDSGFCYLIERSLKEPALTILNSRLCNIPIMESNPLFAQISDFFPNGYGSYPALPSPIDNKRMHLGVGSFVLDQMIEDAKTQFNASLICAFRCSDSLQQFLQKKKFNITYPGSFYLSLT